MGKTYKIEAIIIKRVNYKEADRILTVCTKHHGKLKVLARGVRKITSRRAGSLEPFNQVILFLHKSKFLDIICEVKTINYFKDIRNDLRIISFVYQAGEVVDKLTREGIKQPHVFVLFKDYLSYLTKDLQNNQKRTLQKFKAELLQSLGFLPKDESINLSKIDKYIESIIERKLNSNTLII